jgi:hypothetical protein
VVASGKADLTAFADRLRAGLTPRAGSLEVFAASGAGKKVELVVGKQVVVAADGTIGEATELPAKLELTLEPARKGDKAWILEGAVAGGPARVMVEGTPVQVDAEGRFTHSLRMPAKGPFTAAAVDVAGHRLSQDFPLPPPRRRAATGGTGRAPEGANRTGPVRFRGASERPLLEIAPARCCFRGRVLDGPHIQAQRLRNSAAGGVRPASCRGPDLPSGRRRGGHPRAHRPQAAQGALEGPAAPVAAGVQGGYRLARAPEQISVAEIIAAVEGPIALTECNVPGGEGCERSRDCPGRAPGTPSTSSSRGRSRA